MQVMQTIQAGPQFTPGCISMPVEALQRALARADLDPGPADGNFLPGSATDIAVRAFQSANGITGNGVVGPDTWQALPDADMQGLPTLGQGSEGEAVALIQRCLRRDGFYLNQPIDGVFGPVTANAVDQWQAQSIGAPEGTVNEQVWELLG